MLRVVICDDEPAFVQLLSQKVQQFLSAQNIEYICCANSDATQFLDKCEEIWPDIIFLDIDMPPFSGFDLVRKIPNREEKPILIFVSSQDHLVFDSFTYEPFRFVRKSCLEEIERCLKDALEKIWGRTGRYSVKLLDGQTISLFLDQIVYFQYLTPNVKVVLSNDEEWTRTTLKNLEKDLKERGFFRIYQNILVNMKYVYSVHPMHVVLRYGNRTQQLPVGRTRKEELHKIFLSHTRN